MASRAKEVFQLIVGRRQIFHLVACKEAIPIAGSDFLEVRDRRSQHSKSVLLLYHGCQELLVFSLQGIHIALLGIGEEVGCLMHPCIGLLDRRPEVLGRRQSGLHEPLETAEFVGKPLFCSTRAIESEMS